MKRGADSLNEHAKQDKDLLEFILREQENYVYLGKLHASLYALASKTEDSSEYQQCVVTMQKDMEYVYTQALKQRNHVVIAELKKSHRFDSKLNDIVLVETKLNAPKKKSAKSRLGSYEYSIMQSPFVMQDMNTTPPSSPVKVMGALLGPAVSKGRRANAVDCTQNSVRSQIVARRPQIALEKNFEQVLMCQTTLNADEVVQKVNIVIEQINNVLKTTDLTLQVYRAHLQINMAAVVKYSNAPYALGLRALKLQRGIPDEVIHIVSMYACAVDVEVNPTLLYSISQASPDQCKTVIQDFGSKNIKDFLTQFYCVVEHYKAMRGF